MSAHLAPTAADSGPGVALRRALVLVTCTGVTFLYAMTVTIANVSLPQMQGSLSATQDQIAWVVTFNLIATAVGDRRSPAGSPGAASGAGAICFSVAMAGFGARSPSLCGHCRLSLERPRPLPLAARAAFGAPIMPVWARR